MRQVQEFKLPTKSLGNWSLWTSASHGSGQRSSELLLYIFKRDGNVKNNHSFLFTARFHKFKSQDCILNIENLLLWLVVSPRCFSLQISVTPSNFVLAASAVTWTAWRPGSRSWGGPGCLSSSPRTARWPPRRPPEACARPRARCPTLQRLRAAGHRVKCYNYTSRLRVFRLVCFPTYGVASLHLVDGRLGGGEPRVPPAVA